VWHRLSTGAVDSCLLPPISCLLTVWHRLIACEPSCAPVLYSAKFCHGSPRIDRAKSLQPLNRTAGLQPASFLPPTSVGGPESPCQLLSPSRLQPGLPTIAIKSSEISNFKSPPSPPTPPQSIQNDPYFSNLGRVNHAHHPLIGDCPFGQDRSKGKPQVFLLCPPITMPPLSSPANLSQSSMSRLPNGLLTPLIIARPLDMLPAWPIAVLYVWSAEKTHYGNNGAADVRFERFLYGRRDCYVTTPGRQTHFEASFRRSTTGRMDRKVRKQRRWFGYTRWNHPHECAGH